MNDQRGRVYVLVDPRDQSVRHVGATMRPVAVRLAGHLRKPTHRVRIWIEDLAKAGLRPSARVVQDDIPAVANRAAR